MKLIVRLFVVCFGLAFVLVGYLIWANLGGAARDNAARAESLDPVAAPALAQAAPGAPVLVEGTVSPSNERRFRDFVAYVREEFRGADPNGDEKWERDEVVLPPLTVDAGGPVLVANAEYPLAAGNASWREDGLEWSSRTQEGTKRYTGLAVGLPVMVIGQVADGPAGRGLVAELVYGGTRADYIAEQRARAGWTPWVGLAVGLAGLAVAGFGFWGLRRWR